MSSSSSSRPGGSRAQGSAGFNATTTGNNSSTRSSSESTNSSSSSPQRDPGDYYAVLECSPEASDEELKRAYRRLALLYHPDKQRSDGDRPAAEIRFKLVAEAYECLRDPQQRARYNRWRSDAGTGDEGQSRRARRHDEEEELPREYYQQQQQHPFASAFHRSFFDTAFPSSSSFFSTRPQQRPRSAFDLFREFFGDEGLLMDDMTFGREHGSLSSQQRQHADIHARAHAEGLRRHQQQQQQQQYYEQRPPTHVDPFGVPLPSMMPSFGFGLGGDPFASIMQTHQHMMQQQQQLFQPFAASSSFGLGGGNGSGGVSRSTVTQIVNGRQTTVTTVRDAQGNTTVTRQLPDGTEELEVNGVLQRRIAGYPATNNNNSRLIQGGGNGNRVRVPIRYLDEEPGYPQ